MFLFTAPHWVFKCGVGFIFDDRLFGEAFAFAKRPDRLISYAWGR